MSTLVSSGQDRLDRARLSLEGLSVGDAFGERFFVHPDVVERLLALRALPAPPWPYTDDTEMALSIVAVLRQHDGIEQDALAQSFARHYNPSRGYGPAMHRMLRRVGGGEQWQVVAASLFEGQGSFGNGAAMRVAPLGAYFADDLEHVVEHARRSAEVTHAHPEGVAGAIGIAIAAAWAWRLGQDGRSSTSLIETVLPYLPDSEVQSRLRRALDLAPGTPAAYGAALLGNGSAISAQDTVPYAIWCASEHLADYEAALWHTASGLGDFDTTCAMVGGIVALGVGLDGIPAEWRQSREALPNWSFYDAYAGTVTLYRPVGAAELALIAASGYRAFPPRLPEQPIFYPVLSEAYAAQIARDWNTKNGATGYVTRFEVRASYLERYSVQVAGARMHAEYWIPAEDLETFNDYIVGSIDVIASFEGSPENTQE
jgi:ADP-ribosylglycohydrolase